MKGSSRSLKPNQAFATEQSWIDARLAYRRLVYKMLRDIETHCEDVICLAQNYLQLSLVQFKAICESDEIERIIEDNMEEIGEKQKQVIEVIMEPENQNTRHNSRDIIQVSDLDSTSPTMKVEDEDEETKEGGFSSFETSGISLESQSAISK